MRRWRIFPFLLAVAGCAGESPTGTEPTEPVDTLRFTTLSAGARHTCALTPDGVSYCWGWGTDGALGPARGGVRPVAAPVATELRFTEVTAGSQHTCGIATAGGVHCWGIGSWGGGTDAPALVPGTDDARSLASTFGHVCFLTGEGWVGCFGLSDAGQLGPSVEPGGWSGGAVIVPDLTGMVDVAAGKNHTCALEADGAAWCWGVGEGGQLGLGDELESCPFGTNGADVPCSRAPARVAADAPFVDLVAGWYHTCGLHDDGTLTCWGDDAQGQLGAEGAAPDTCTWSFDLKAKPCRARARRSRARAAPRSAPSPAGCSTRARSTRATTRSAGG